MQTLTAIIPISSSRDDFDRLEGWISDSDLSGVTLIMVFDSCTPDKRYQMLAQKSSASEIVLTEGKFGGPGPARNEGLRLAETEWACFWDSDDIPNVANIKNALVELSENGSEIGILEFKIVNSPKTGIITNTQYVSHNSEDLLQLVQTPGIWRFIFKTSVIKDLIFPSIRMGEDQVFLIQALDRTTRIRWINSCGYTYIKHNNLQLTKNKSAINELINSTILVNEQLSHVTSNLQLKIGVIIRQCITVLLRSHWSQKLRGLRLLLKTISTYPKISAKTLARLIGYKGSASPNAIHVALNGGLGNQLFEITAALFYSRNHEVIVDSAIGEPRRDQSGLAAIESFEFPPLVNFVHRNKSWLLSKAANYVLRDGLTSKNSVRAKLARFLTAIIASSYFKSQTHLIVNQGVGWSGEGELRSRSNLLIGYFQSYRFQLPQTISMLQESFKRFPGGELSELRKLAILERPLVVHVRLSDYLLEPDFGIPSRDYYLRAIKLAYNPMVHKKIWLFSDDIEAAQNRIPENLLEITRQFDVIDGSDQATLVAMTLGEDFVIANSTFSWWAARLGSKEDSIVVHPSPWFKNMPEPIDLIPPRWVAIPADF